MSKLTIYTDGGSRGNPGPAACGAAFYQNKKLIAQSSWYLGKATNNQAEYQGVYYALRFIQRNPDIFLQFSQIDFVLDSQLVVRQLTGQYKIKNKQLQKLAKTIQTQIKQLNKPVNLRHVLRENNKTADKLLNQELDLYQ